MTTERSVVDTVWLVVKGQASDLGIWGFWGFGSFGVLLSCCVGVDIARSSGQTSEFGVFGVNFAKTTLKDPKI